MLREYNIWVLIVIFIFYLQTKEELDRLRRDIVRSPKSPKTSLAAQAVLRRVENERDDAIAELRRMGTERDSLRERLKVSVEVRYGKIFMFSFRIRQCNFGGNITVETFQSRISCVFT